MSFSIKSDCFTYSHVYNLYRCENIDKYDPEHCPICGGERIDQPDVEWLGCDEIKVTQSCENKHEWTEVYTLSRVFFDPPARADYELYVASSGSEMENMEPTKEFMVEDTARRAFTNAVWDILFGKNEDGNTVVSLNRTDPSGSDTVIAYFQNAEL